MQTASDACAPARENNLRDQRRGVDCREAGGDEGVAEVEARKTLLVGSPARGVIARRERCIAGFGLSKDNGFVDQTDARKATVRRFGRSDRSARQAASRPPTTSLTPLEPSLRSLVVKRYPWSTLGRGIVSGLLEHRLEVRLRGLQSSLVRPLQVSIFAMSPSLLTAGAQNQPSRGASKPATNEETQIRHVGSQETLFLEPHHVESPQSGHDRHHSVFPSQGMVPASNRKRAGHQS